MIVPGVTTLFRSNDPSWTPSFAFSALFVKSSSSSYKYADLVSNYSISLGNIQVSSKLFDRIDRKQLGCKLLEIEQWTDSQYCLMFIMLPWLHFAEYAKPLGRVLLLILRAWVQWWPIPLLPKWQHNYNSVTNLPFLRFFLPHLFGHWVFRQLHILQERLLLERHQGLRKLYS